MGRRPSIDAPSAAPMKPDSLIGVSMIRPRPNSATSPFVAPRDPPIPAALSNSGMPAPPARLSPMWKTFGSLRISCFSVSLIASRNVSILSTRCHLIRRIRVFERFLRTGHRGLQRFGEGGIDLLMDLCFDLGEFLHSRYAVRGHESGKLLDGIFLFLQPKVLLGLVLRRAVLVIAVDPPTLCVDQRLPFSPSRPLDCPLRRRENLEEVAAINRFPGDRVPDGPVGYILRRITVEDGCILGISVVLADVDNRQFPDRGEVDRLMKSPLVRGAVPKEADADVVGLLVPEAEAQTRRHRESAADDSICPVHSLLHVHHMHRTAFAPAQPRLGTTEFCKHCDEIAALRDAMTVAAVSSDDCVISSQVLASSNGD